MLTDRQFETKTAEMNTTEQMANDGLALLKQRLEGRKSLEMFQGWLKEREDRYRSRFDSELSTLNQMIEEAEQAISDCKKIASSEDADLLQSLETNRALFSLAPAALDSLLLQKVQLEKKIAEAIDNDEDVQSWNKSIALTKIRFGFTD